VGFSWAVWRKSDRAWVGQTCWSVSWLFLVFALVWVSRFRNLALALQTRSGLLVGDLEEVRLGRVENIFADL
jgi:hypothetical protein